jgi:hypothetical protein
MTKRIGVPIRLAVAFAIGALFLVVFAPAHTNASASAAGTSITAGTSISHDTSTSCPPESNSCAPTVNLPCAAGPQACTVTAGPTSQLGQGQAVYVNVTGLENGEQIALAVCPLTSTGQPTYGSPSCASNLPAGADCGDSCNPTPTPLEWQYVTGSGVANTVLSIGTEYDPNGPEAKPILSQSTQQYGTQTPNGSFFCDNGPASPCGVEVMDLGLSQDVGYVKGDGYPPIGASGKFDSEPSNTVMFPLNWAATGSGCGSAPDLTVDASYSVAQFLPAAGAATCTGTDGVGILPASEPSVDDSSCQSSGTGHCPITDVINGTQPASFTDDPNDPTTVAELKAAGGKFAYIPIAVSSTEIAFEGQTGRTGVGAITYPLSNYNLTPAQTAGILTQNWHTPIAQIFAPADDLCSQLTGVAQCTETATTAPQAATAYEVNGQTANIDVSLEGGGQPDSVTLPAVTYTGTFSNPSLTNPEKNYTNDTGYALLNPWPGDSGPQPTSENNLDAMFPSTGSGASYETTDWICNSPDLPFKVNLPWGGNAMLSDLESGQQVLANGEQDPILMTPNDQGVLTEQSTVTQYFTADPSGCEATSTLPTDFGAPGDLTYAPSSEPLTAAHAIQAAISNNLLGFAFSAMDSSEADFFGLLPADLQNAAGAFVPPSAASIDAALGDESPSPNGNGTLVPNFTNTSDAAAYPMPMVTYALISTSPQSSTDQADQLTELLTNLVNYSASGGSGTSDPLPPGYAPLPASLQKQALSEITSDVIAPNGQPVGGETAAAASLAANSTSSSSGGSNSFDSSADGFSSFSGALGAPFGAAGLAKVSGSGAAKAAANSSGGGGSIENPIGRFIAVTLGDNRYLVPGLLLLALLCLVAGPLLYLSPSLRKTANATADGGGEGAGEGGSPPPEE